MRMMIKKGNNLIKKVIGDFFLNTNMSNLYLTPKG